MPITRTMLATLLMSVCSLTISGQKGKTPQCVNSSALVTLHTDPGAMIRPDGGGSYAATLLNCSNETGDVQILIGAPNNSRRVVRDFSERILVAPQDDPVPNWNTPVQDGPGAIYIRRIVVGYVATGGYAQGYPVAKCWEQGRTPNDGCTFTSAVMVNFADTNGDKPQLFFRNPDADTSVLESAGGYDNQLDELLNAAYILALVRVTYIAAADHRYDMWEVEPLPSTQSGAPEGKFVGSLFRIVKGKIQRYGYFNMYFRMTVSRGGA